MDDGLKQRLIGAIVLVALAVLFLPSLFSTNSRQRVDLTSQIPSEPLDIPAPLQIERPVRPQGIPQAPPLEEYYQHEVEGEVTVSPPENVEVATKPAGSVSNSTTATPTVPISEPPAPTPPIASASQGGASVPAAWSIQVGSFQSEERAQALTQKLLDENYKAYMRRSNVGAESRYRVFVGPKINRDDALREKAKLEKALKIEALLVTFKP